MGKPWEISGGKSDRARLCGAAAFFLKLKKKTKMKMAAGKNNFNFLQTC